MFKISTIKEIKYKLKIENIDYQLPFASCSYKKNKKQVINLYGNKLEKFFITRNQKI